MQIVSILPPLFGTNPIQSDSIRHNAHSYKTDDGNYISEVQYVSGNDYSNAVFYTDSLHFSVFVGVYFPGSRENLFAVKQLDNEHFAFYNMTAKQQVDTVKFDTFPLQSLKKKGFMKVCEDPKK